MKNHPKLKFIIEAEKDIEVYLGFWESSKYYKNLKKDLDDFFYGLYPQLKYLKKNKNNSKRIQRREIKKFVEDFYEKNKAELKIQTLKAQKDWNKNENKFFKLTDKIFKNCKWPKGDYVAYVTTWGTFPRFLHNKTFQFPYKYKNKKFVLAVASHEMLHFIFYEYAIKKHRKLFKKLETERGIFWDLAEIFNSVMHKTELIKIHGKMNGLVYSGHKKILPYFIKSWKKNQNIDVWIEQGFEYLRKGK